RCARTRTASCPCSAAFWAAASVAARWRSDSPWAGSIGTPSRVSPASVCRIVKTGNGGTAAGSKSLLISLLHAVELPVPRLGVLLSLLRPVGVLPPVAACVLTHPLVLRAAELVDPSAEVHSQCPPVVRGARLRGHAVRFRLVEVFLLGIGPVRSEEHTSEL